MNIKTMNLGQLRVELDNATEAARALNAKYGNSPMPPSEATILDGHLSRAEELGAEIDARLRGAQDAVDGGAPGAQFVNVDDRPVRVMRSSADFRAHYRSLRIPLIADTHSRLIADTLGGVPE